jgi:hypothetical protein
MRLLRPRTGSSKGERLLNANFAVGNDTHLYRSCHCAGRQGEAAFDALVVTERQAERRIVA